MMTTEDFPERHRYLSLGFFAQKLITALIEFVEEGRTEGLDEKLKEAIESLESAERLELRPGVRAFRSYQEVRTLQDVSETQSSTDISEILRDILQTIDTGITEELRVKTGHAIEWFGVLQNQALRNYSGSSEPIPRGIGELCPSR